MFSANNWKLKKNARIYFQRGWDQRGTSMRAATGDRRWVASFILTTISQDCTTSERDIKIITANVCVYERRMRNVARPEMRGYFSAANFPEPSHAEMGTHARAFYSHALANANKFQRVAEPPRRKRRYERRTLQRGPLNWISLGCVIAAVPVKMQLPLVDDPPTCFSFWNSLSFRWKKCVAPRHCQMRGISVGKSAHYGLY